MDIVTLALAKAYANKVAAGYSNIIAEGNTLIFKYNDGTEAKITIPAVEGKSAYQIWLEQGNTGTEQDFLNSLVGAGIDGEDGKSAYKIWLEQGNAGTEQDFIDSLMGQDGQDGKGITKIEKTNTVGLIDTYTITYTDGTTSIYNVKNGADGKDGYIPVKGVDYFTEEDKQELINLTLAALPNSEEVSY